MQGNRNTTIPSAHYEQQTFNILIKYIILLFYPGKDEDVFRAFSEVPNIQVFRKDEIPADMHYSQNRRIMPIIVQADLGYDLRTCAGLTCKTEGKTPSERS